MAGSRARYSSGDAPGAGRVGVDCLLEGGQAGDGASWRRLSKGRRVMMGERTAAKSEVENELWGEDKDGLQWRRCRNVQTLPQPVQYVPPSARELPGPT